MQAADKRRHQNKVREHRKHSIRQMKTEKPTCLPGCGRLSAVRPRPALVPEEIVQHCQLHRDRGGRQIAHPKTSLEERKTGELYDDSGASDGVEPEAMLHKGSAR